MIKFSKNYDLPLDVFAEVNVPSVEIFGELLGAMYEVMCLMLKNQST